MRVGLLNGSDRYVLNGSWIRVAQVIEASVGVKCGIVLEKRDGDHSRSWSATIDDLRSDPTSSDVRSLTSDFRAVFWAKAGLFAVAGASKVVFVDVVSGAIECEQELEFVDNSLDILQIVINPSESVLVVVSSFLVVAWSYTRSLRWKWRPESLISGIAEVGADGFTLNRYDYDTDTAAKIENYLAF